MRTKRTLITDQDCPGPWWDAGAQLDLDVKTRDAFYLLTPQNAHELPKGAVSTHKLLKAFAANKGLEERFGDIA